MKELLTAFILILLVSTTQAQIKPPKYQKAVKVYINEFNYEARNVSIGLPGAQTGSGKLSGSVVLFNPIGNFHELELQHISWSHTFSWRPRFNRHILSSNGMQLRYERAIRIAKKFLDKNTAAYIGPSLSLGYGNINCYTDSLEGPQYQVRNKNFSLGLVLRGSFAISSRLSVEANVVIDGFTFQSNRVKKLDPNFPDTWNPYEHGNHQVENQFVGRIGIAVKL